MGDAACSGEIGLVIGLPVDCSGSVASPRANAHMSLSIGSGAKDANGKGQRWVTCS